MEYETEEQQVEAIKKWWKENKMNVVGGIVVGAAAIFGWRGYGDMQTQHLLDASVLYEQVKTDAISASNLEQQDVRVNELMADFDDTPYVSLAVFAYAKQLLQKPDMVKSQQQLDWVLKNGQDEFKVMARLKLARILLSVQQYDEAIKVLSIDYPKSFAALYEELKGDIYLSQGKNFEARSAYDKAMLVSDNKASQWLRLKRDEIGLEDKAAPSA